MTPEDEEYLKGRVAFLEFAVLALMSKVTTDDARENWYDSMQLRIRANSEQEECGHREQEAAQTRRGACAIKGRSRINEEDEKMVDNLFASASRRSGRRNLKPESD